MSALAAVRAAATERLAGQTLSGVGNTQRPMHERFQRHVSFFIDRADFFDGKLSRQNDSFDTKFRRNFDALSTGQRHLRRGVNRQIGASRADQSSEANVLYQNRVDTCFGEFSNQKLDDFQLAWKCQRVESNVAFDASPMHEVHQVR